MLSILKNDKLTVTVSDHGAELQSILTADGTEHLWQGDPTIWSDRAPNLFPYIGRMINKEYTYRDKRYNMNIHGFVMYRDLQLVKKAERELVYRLTEDEATLAQYPWKFSYEVHYELTDARLNVTYRVENRDGKEMLFSVGGHPGFNTEDLEIWQLRFSAPCAPKRVIFTPDCFVDDHKEDFMLKDGSTIALHHDLFDDDAIVLSGTSGVVTLERIDGSRRITVCYPGMDYIGFWTMPKVNAPYLCIEPWSGLPSPKGDSTDLEAQKDLIHLAPGKEYTTSWSIEIV